ncbi:MAG: hypothetical protein HQ481_12370 [Alphaproteobacteria bacterium]|nr:hypothetical protein [Alphaproteobacteria bacterium]
MRLIGGLLGLILGVGLGVLALLGLGLSVAPIFSVWISIMQPLATALNAVALAFADAVVIAFGLGPAARFILFAVPFLAAWGVITLLIVTLFYAAAAVVVWPYPPDPDPTLPTPPVQVATTALERLCLGAMIGIASGANLAMWWSGNTLAATILAILAGLLFLAVLQPVSSSAIFKAVAGNLGWLMPMSWPTTIIGVVFAFYAGFLGLRDFGIAAFRFDFTTGTIEISARIFPAATWTGFTLGNFTFQRIPPGAALPAPPHSFFAPSPSTHETGHVLTNALMGWPFLALSGIDENYVRTTSAFAYSELIIVGHAQEDDRWYIEMLDP